MQSETPGPGCLEDQFVDSAVGFLPSHVTFPGRNLAIVVPSFAQVNSFADVGKILTCKYCIDALGSGKTRDQDLAEFAISVLM